jgi:peptide methionine sulfoxide reductase MsrB
MAKTTWDKEIDPNIVSITYLQPLFPHNISHSRRKETTYYDSVSGKPLFVAPRGRSFEEFKKESIAHGWPSFRDEECIHENIRCLEGGEAISLVGTHLGHNLPDSKGNRYCAYEYSPILSRFPPSLPTHHPRPHTPTPPRTHTHTHTNIPSLSSSTLSFACSFPGINLCCVAGRPE